MNDQHHYSTINFDYEYIPENDSINILDNEFKNSMEIFIAEYIGTIPKNYFVGLIFFLNSKKKKDYILLNI